MTRPNLLNFLYFFFSFSKREKKTQLLYKLLIQEKTICYATVNEFLFDSRKKKIEVIFQTLKVCYRISINHFVICHLGQRQKTKMNFLVCSLTFMNFHIPAFFFFSFLIIVSNFYSQFGP